MALPDDLHQMSDDLRAAEKHLDPGGSGRVALEIYERVKRRLRGMLHAGVFDDAQRQEVSATISEPLRCAQCEAVDDGRRGWTMRRDSDDKHVVRCVDCDHAEFG